VVQAQSVEPRIPPPLSAPREPANLAEGRSVMPARSVRPNEENNSFPETYPGPSVSEPEARARRWHAGLAVPCRVLLLITGCAWATYRQNQYRRKRSTIDASFQHRDAAMEP